MFLASLALADLFVGLLVMSFSLANRLLGRWTFGVIFCRMWISFDVMCCTSSILHLCAICTDRFLHIKDPYAYTQYMHKRLVFFVILAIWLLSALISFLPLSLGWHQWGLHHTESDYNDHQSLFPVRFNYSTNQTEGSGFGVTWARSTGTESPSFEAHAHLVTSNAAHSHLPASSTSSLAFSGSFHKAQSTWPTTSHNLNQVEECNLEFSPIYAVISSCISFYLPCLIMIALYTRLYLYARKHVRDIKRTMCKAPAPMAATLAPVAHAPPPPPTPACALPVGPAFGALEPSHKPLGHRASNSSSSATHVNLQDSNRLQVKSAIRPSVSSNVLQNNSSQSIVDHKAAITIGIIMGSFLLCWVPFFLMNIVLSMCKDCVSDILFNLLTWLGWLNSALNPIIYSIFNTEFRRAFHRILTGHVNFGRCTRVLRPATRATVCTLLPHKNTSPNQYPVPKPISPTGQAKLKSTLSSEPIDKPVDRSKLNVTGTLAHSHSQPSLPNSAQLVMGEFENAQPV